MKKIKLKQTKLCFLISLLPILAVAALSIISFIITGNEEEESLWHYFPIIETAVGIAGIAVFFHYFGTVWLVFLGTITGIDAWKKDRRFYFTEVNGRSSQEASDAIKFRMKHYGKELEITDKPEALVCACKKRRHSSFDETSGFEDYYILYKTQSLTSEFCSNAVTESKRIMRKFAEKGLYPFLRTKRDRKKPVTHSCALVIVCHTVGSFNAGEYVRKNFTKGHTGLAVCIYEAATGRYFFNGSLLSFNTLLPASDPDGVSINLIKKAVFCKKLGLRENSYYMPTDKLPYDPEMTLCEALKEIQKEVKNTDRENKKTVKRLKDGEVYFDGDIIFYKKDERALLFSVVSEEECEGEIAEGEIASGKKYVLTDKSWSYPKKSKISKKDYEQALVKIEEYLNFKCISFEFTELEKWLEKE